MQKKVIVIGGGFAGLTTAAYLVKNNYRAILLEASPKLGGRAYSFKDKETNTILDNGQHILMGCYFETLKFLNLIGATNNFYFQKKLEVNFVKENFDLQTLKAFPGFYPINLLIGLLNFKAISFGERLRLLKICAKLPFYSTKEYSELSIKDWLEIEKQPKNVQDAFWKILAVGALNTNIEKASAGIFINILKQIFFNGSKAASIVLPKYGLSESYSKNAEDFISENGGEIELAETVNQISIENNLINKIETANTSYTDFDFVVSAIPAYALSKIINDKIEIDFPDFNYSSILNIHLWLEENIFRGGFYGLINSPVHWVFNKDTHLNLVISDADHLVSKSDDETLEMVTIELKKFFNLNPRSITHHKIIKEKRATFVPSADVLNDRPTQKTNIKNLVLAGDWVETKLPSTIESAVKSGRIAADIISNQLL
ncbi:MAG: NAD(P)-binding protein [Ignavibacteriaceae bacterium]|nr:NAD(P)-binding protein [Ignavibacteriaceae bacterium]